MEDQIVAFDRVCELPLVEHVAFNQVESRLFLCLVQKPKLSGREVVVGGDGVTGFQQAVNEVAANESGPAGDEVSHHSVRSLIRGRQRLQTRTGYGWSGRVCRD